MFCENLAVFFRYLNKINKSIFKYYFSDLQILKEQ